MEYEIKHRPSYALLEVSLGQNETVRAEAGAMTYMSPNIEVNTRMREASFLETLGLRILGMQSFFVNDYTARNGEGKIGLVAAPVGDMAQIPVAPHKGYVIQKSSYVASSPSVELDIKWQGFTKGVFGQGLFMIRVVGQGELFINTFGAIEQKTINPGEELMVDNFHLVAFSDSCTYEVTKFGGLKSTLLGGEGLVVRIKGPGEVYIQTKNPGEFAEWLWALLEPRVRARAR
ncbi:MAG: TIGR00266 family protein [Thaumarchaeota archaeon]|nr:TIGR00266 family protein [Nitrososphaerota archaeon]MCS4540386.1 TIGR00266 family protein [Nitrososphaerota archaeon]